MAIGINKIKVIAMAAIAGSVINLPISCYLTVRLGVSGVIWGTVLTTLFSNLLIPGIYLFRVLEIDPRTYLTRTLGPPLAGTAALLISTTLMSHVLPIPNSGQTIRTRGLLLLIHLVVGTVAYVGGYLVVRTGRSDLAELAAKVRRR
jgi:O-antigen/teichoic acid export membrane protein